jgi:BirA family biotin operon repressor/biotin-[acetyl-CoA-carboxylase] ligase
LGIEDVALKWPNDVLLAGRKLGGILVELASSAVVIGVGLNLRLPPDLPRDLLDVAAAIDRPLDCNDLLAKILLAIRGVLDAFAIGGFQMLKARWMALNAYADVSVQVLSEFAPPLIGRCCAVADDGALLIDTPVGVQRVISGDVSLRPA